MGSPLEDCDLLAASFPLPLARKSHIALTAKAKELDKALLDGLERVGFRLDYGEDGTGWQFKYSPAAAATISTSAAPI